MPAKRYCVTLSEAERNELSKLVNTGQAAARTLTRARILLLADEGLQGPGYKDEAIVVALGISRPTVERIRQRYVEQGLTALAHKTPVRSRPRVLDGRAEAHLVALTCSAAPAGREHWTMQLLADKLMDLGIVERVSDETVRTTLKKTNLSPGKTNSG